MTWQFTFQILSLEYEISVAGFSTSPGNLNKPIIEMSDPISAIPTDAHPS